jgi:hypothetical protein
MPQRDAAAQNATICRNFAPIKIFKHRIFLPHGKNSDYKHQETQPVDRSLFRNYYRNHARFEVDAVERQEFALQPFSGGMIRHKAFKTLEELKKFVIEKAPRHIA